MSMMENINKLFGNRQKAFVVDGCKSDMEIIKSMNLDIDQYTDFKQLLYKLRTSKTQKYKVGIIHQNGTKYPSQMLSNFIKLIDPSIRLIIYKDGSQLRKETETMV